ncbi:hypothetical protein [Mangrovimonas cancribranchiae]|uniref:Uncharacterized protein n=1 Tax=Mangrovimonas cancribranchiae TaxID=3080055 RepID=A0AAU6P688_9FLAO
MKIKLIYIFIITLISFSCSSDDDSADNEILRTNNQVSFEGENYPLSTVLIFDENIETDEPSDIGFNLYNKTTNEINSALNGETDLTNIVHFYFDFTEVDLQETTYTDILDYSFSINGTLSDGNYDDGTEILSDNDPNSELYASNSVVTINNLTETTVDLSFSFTRNDGQVISGSYNGAYDIPTP